MQTQTINRGDWITADAIDAARRALRDALPVWDNRIRDRWDITEDGETWSVIITGSAVVEVYGPHGVHHLLARLACDASQLPRVLAALGLPEVVDW